MALLARCGERGGFRVRVSREVTDGSQFHPDMVLTRDGSTIISDVEVSWSSERGLRSHYNDKVNKYNRPDIIAAVAAYEGVEPSQVRVLCCLVGGRGVWCRENADLAQAIGLSQQNEKRDSLEHPQVGHPASRSTGTS